MKADYHHHNPKQDGEANSKAPEINELENGKHKLINAFRIWLFKRSMT